MATATGMTAARMLQIEGASVVSGEVVGDDLILKTHNGVTFNAGNVRGDVGPSGSSDPQELADLVNEVGGPNPLAVAIDDKIAAGGGGLPFAGSNVLAFAERASDVGTSFPVGPNWTSIVGCQLLVPPTDYDVYIFWKTHIGLSVAGQGRVATGVWDVTGANDFVVTCKGWRKSRFYTNSLVTQNADEHFGFANVGKSSVNRSFQLSGITVQEGSNLIGYSRDANDGYESTWMMAVML